MTKSPQAHPSFSRESRAQQGSPIFVFSGDGVRDKTVLYTKSALSETAENQGQTSRDKQGLALLNYELPHDAAALCTDCIPHLGVSSTCRQGRGSSPVEWQGLVCLEQ